MDARQTRRIEARGARIERAIKTGERITFTYRGEQRELSPYELRAERTGYQHRRGDAVRGADVIGWDHRRDAYRTFKLADVRHVARTGLPAREAA